MSEKTYGSLITNAGNALIAQAMLAGPAIDLTTFAIGDGDGAYYLPTENMTALKREVWRGPINSVTRNGDSPNMLDVRAIVPSTAGGFTIREMALIAASGEMFAICNTPDTEKVVIASGAEGEIELLMHVAIASAAIDKIEFTVDPNVIVATKRDIETHNPNPDPHGSFRAFAVEPGGLLRNLVVYGYLDGDGIAACGPAGQGAIRASGSTIVLSPQSHAPYKAPSAGATLVFFEGFASVSGETAVL